MMYPQNRPPVVVRDRNRFVTGFLFTLGALTAITLWSFVGAVLWFIFFLTLFASRN